MGWCVPSTSEKFAGEAIIERSKLHHDASHHCWAWRLGNPEHFLERYSDAGEPSGTAGKPILDQIKKRNLFDTVVVVTRWFGGTKLGKGGLVRAYSFCAAETLQLVHMEMRIPQVKLMVTCHYNLIGLVENLTSRYEGSITDAVYADNATLTIKLPSKFDRNFKEQLYNSSSGKIDVNDLP